MPTKLSATLGPVACGTVVSRDIDELAAVYTEHLAMTVVERGEIPSPLAIGWGLPKTTGLRYCLLGSESGANWLRLIEDPSCMPLQPLSTRGWMSMEVLVSDVYALAERLRDSPFRFIGEPKALDLSPDIEACQVVGPAGEVLYLTTVRNPVPPFDLPMAKCEVDQLFIPVLAVPNRDESTALYAQLGSEPPLNFDTKVTVINRALGHPIDRRMPVASSQLRQQHFMEIDEVAEFPKRPLLPCGLHAGITMVSFWVDSLDNLPFTPQATPYYADSVTYQQRRAALFIGTGGEYIELIER